MRKTNTISGIKALTYLGLMEFTNNLRLVITHPLGIINGVFKLLLSVVFIIWIPFILNNRATKERLLSFHAPVNIIGAALMLLLMVVCFFVLKKAIENYYPTHYSAADTNWLFTSPISSRLNFAWSIIKQIGSALFGGLFMALPLYLMFRASYITVDAGKFAYAFAGIVVFIIIVQTLGFFLYSVSKRFNIATLVQALFYMGFGTVAIYILISLAGSGDLLQILIEILGGKAFEKIPVIGWTKSLIMNPFTKFIPVMSLVKLVLFAAIMLFITIYLATDYYEEALISTERITKIKAALAGNNMEEAQRLAAKQKLKVKMVRSGWNLKRAYAFLWKAIIIHKRKSRGVAAETAKYIFYTFVGVVFGYIFRNRAYQELILFVIILPMIFNQANTNYLEGLEYELKKNYLFLLPGRVRDKILAINIIPVIKLLIRNLVIIAPLALFLKVNLVQLSSIWVVLSAINLMNLFTVAAIKVIIPFGDNKNMLFVYLRHILETLFALPAAGAGVLIYILSKNIEVALFIFSISGILTVNGLLYISETYFSRLELNN